MLYNRNVFRILEIEPTDDKKKIKKAYARLVKQYHPEEYPKKWKEIHDAYETALKMAEHMPFFPPARAAQKDSVPITKTEHMEDGSLQTREQAVSEANEIDTLFDRIEQLSEEQQKQNEEGQKLALQKVISQLNELAGKKKLYREEWENFFYQEDILPLISTREFLHQLGDCFVDRKINEQLYQLLEEQLQLIKKYNADRNIVLRKIGLIDPVVYAGSMIRGAYKANLHHGKNVRIEKKKSGAYKFVKKMVLWIKERTEK